MSFESLQAFLSMGGHGVYVWTVYLTALTLLVGNFIGLRRTRQRTLRELRALHAAPSGATAPPAEAAAQPSSSP